MKREDFASPEEIMRGDFAPAMDAVIVISRDAKLVAAIDSMSDLTTAPSSVGIAYGAGHNAGCNSSIHRKVSLQGQQFRAANCLRLCRRLMGAP